MDYPALWMWLVAIGTIVAGLWLSRSPRFNRSLVHLPRWFCAFLALAGLVGMWFLLNAQFGGLVIQFHLP